MAGAQIRHDIALLTDIIANMQSDDKGIEIKCRAQDILTKVLRFKDTPFENLKSAESRDESYIADIYVTTFNHLIDVENRQDNWPIRKSWRTFLQTATHIRNVQEGGL